MFVVKSALIVMDMLNTYRHEDAATLQESVARMAEPLSGLVRRVRESGREDVLLVHVNDNHGDFAATRDDLVEKALKGERPDLVEPFVPAPDCVFLSKVRHSAFYGTPLEYVLQRAGVDRLILTGQVTEQCVLYTALDAYVRHFAIQVPRDAVAAIDPELGTAALQMMERNMRADLVTSGTCFPVEEEDA